MKLFTFAVCLMLTKVEPFIKLSHINSLWVENKIMDNVPSRVSTYLNQPPVGAQYQKTLSYPLVGQQLVRITINDNKHVSIKMNGIVNFVGDVEYKLLVRLPDNRIHFILPSKLQRILDRFKVTINNASYNHETDSASLTIKIHLIRINKRIQLERVDTC